MSALLTVWAFLKTYWREVGCALAVVFFMLWRQAAAGLAAMSASKPVAVAAQTQGAQASAGNDVALHVKAKPQPKQPAPAAGCPPCRECEECPDLDLILKSYCTGSASQAQTATAQAAGGSAFKAWALGAGVAYVQADVLQPYLGASYFRPWGAGLDLGLQVQVVGPWALNRLGDPAAPPPPWGLLAGPAVRF